MKIAVLGGAGYIGSHTVRELCGRGHSVTVIDNLQTGYLASVDKHAEFLCGDIRDKEFLRDSLCGAGFDTVIHFAGCSLVGESVTDPLHHM